MEARDDKSATPAGFASDLTSLAALPILLLLDFGIGPASRATACEAEGGPPSEKPAGQEFALRGQRAAREIKYSDWRKICFKVPGTNMVCRTSISRHV